MRKPALIVASALLLVLIFWGGFAANFPGEALSRIIAVRLNRLPNVEARLSPASLGLISIVVDDFSLNLTQPGQTLLVLKDLRIPFSWALFSGLPVEARIGSKGELEAFIPWEEGEMTIEGKALRFEDIPAFTALAPAKLRGDVSFSGKFQLTQKSRGRGANSLPVGKLTARAEAVELANLAVLGAALPVTRLESVEVSVKTGKRIEVEKITLKGDVQGSVKGFIQPRLNSFAGSPMQLDVAISFNQAWMGRLGPMRPLVEGFLKNGRLEAVLGGSVGRPSFKLGKGTR